MEKIRLWASFWLSCLHWAFWRWERGDAVVTPIFPILTSSFSWVLTLAGTVGFFRDASWLIYVPFGLLLLIVILVAPYGLWREQQVRADEAERKLKPHIIVKPIILSWNKACIRITNLGNETIKNCVGYLKVVYHETDTGKLKENRQIKPVYLQWSPRHGGQNRKKELTFIREADLNVVTIYKSALREGGRYKFKLALFDSYLYEESFLEGNPPHILDIEIVAENCAPIRQKYELNEISNDVLSETLKFGVYNQKEIKS